MRTVKIIPISKRAKDRVAQHGEKFRMLTMDSFQGKEAIFVESLDKTSVGQRNWYGWFDAEEIDLDGTLQTVTIEDSPM